MNPKRIFLRAASLLLAASLASACPAAAKAVASVPDAARLIARMSLEEKVGQLFMIYFSGPKVSDFCREAVALRRVGGFILYSQSGNIENPAQTAELCAGLQELAAAGRQRIGALIAIDQEGGPVVRLTRGVTWFPSQMAVAATSAAPFWAGKMAAAQAAELASLGINVNFTPVADVNLNPDNPVIGARSFGSHPAAVSRLVRAAVRGYAGSGVLCCLKHFPGHGDTSVDSHVGLPVSSHDRATLETVDFAPFRAGIIAGAPLVMTAHVETPALDATPGLPATLSPEVLTGALRRELRFHGPIITDSLGMGAVVATFGESRAALMSFQAGADILLFGADKGAVPENYVNAYELVLNAARSGEISRKRLDASLTRILRVKARLGLIGQPARSAKSDAWSAARLAERLATPAHVSLAREIAEKSLTLVWGDPGGLPFDGGKTLIVWPDRPAELVREALGDLAARYGCGLIVTAADPAAAEVERVAAQAAGYERVVMLTREARRNAGQAALLARLIRDKPGAVLAAATGGPYDAGVARGAAWFAAAYCDAPETIGALGRAVFAGGLFPGKLPVDLTSAETGR